ncbi:MAG: glutamate--tRNA ligase [Sphingomonadales bacterium]|nr:glutamate--tRNA ligase [Sphingomonadales bacterium]
MTPEFFTPDATQTPEQIEAAYPPRGLPASAAVTRFGPSPTGFVHIGGLYTALISRRLARQTNGIFFLRIEDTDKKREVDGAEDLIVAALDDWGMAADEGLFAHGEERGAYGPYRQSERKPIYQAFVRKLLAGGHAYPCFATAEELQALREQQQKQKVPPGYYGNWAIWRDRTPAEVEAALAAGKDFVIRLRSPKGLPDKITLPDVVRGELALDTNRQDAVLLKADGMPTYHLAHVVDDHLMRTTHVIRGHEWLSSYPLHAQLFELLEWERPQFAHISPIEKMDGSSRRKLSKRKDPEASVEFYLAEGYPQEAVIDYLINLADGKFEDWRKENPTADAAAVYPLDLERMNRSGALFDSDKLDSISRDWIGAMSDQAIYQSVSQWAQRHDPAFALLLDADPDYATAIFGIERHGERVRKDIAHWSQVPGDISFFFDSAYQIMVPQAQELLLQLDPAPPAQLLRDVVAGYDSGRTRDEWLEWMRGIGERHGYAQSMKVYKADKEAWRGHFGDMAAQLRIILAARRNTPDLYEIMQVLGPDRVRARIATAADWLGS